MVSKRLTRVLFYAVVTPLGLALRPVWRRRLVLDRSTGSSYWHERKASRANDRLRSQR